MMQLIRLNFRPFAPRRVLFTCFLLLWLTACATAQESKSDTAQSNGEGARIELENVWARPVKVMAMGEAAQEDEAPADGMTSAVYLTIKNNSTQDDILNSAHVDEVAKVVELHKTTMENDVMKMQPVEGGIPIPAGEQVELKPGDYHIMLIDVQYNLKGGDHFKVELDFEKAGTLTVEAEVREP